MKKAKAIAIQRENQKKRLFMLFAAPALIALIYYLFSAAHAWGNTNDYRLKAVPPQQGWQSLKPLDRNAKAEEAIAQDEKVQNKS